MVADGAGQLWLLGAWRLTRVDPATGKSTSWDASDDAAFAQAGYGVGLAPGAVLAASTGSGVWLVGRDRARLFDGRGFVRDLRVPAGLMGEAASGSVSFVTDLVEVGSDVWMSVQTLSDDSSTGRVVRWSGGTWTAMSREEDGIGGYLAVDIDGGVWAGGRWDSGVYSGRTPAVRRWDGSAWTRPGDGQADVPAVWGDVVADPTGGVWVLTERAETGVSDGDGFTLAGAATIHRFDGSTWRSMPHVLTRWAPDDLSDRSGWLAVTPSGQAWVVAGDYDQDAGESGVTRISPEGTVDRLASNGAASDGCGSLRAGLAVVGDAVFAMDPSGVLNLAAVAPTRVWEGDTTAAMSSQFSSFTAMSRDEVLVESNTGGEGLIRYRDGTWAPFGPRLELGVDTHAVASDGALWILDGDDGELTRTAQGDTRRAASDVQGFTLLAGGNGSVWVQPLSDDDPVIGYRPDGARVAIGKPRGYPSTCLMAAGRDGTVWVGAAQYDDEEEEYDCSSVRKLARWDGSRWEPVDLPRAKASATAVAASDDGAGWVLFSSGDDEDYVIGRYVDGRWKVFDTNAYVHAFSFKAAPRGRVCAGETADTSENIVCYGPLGEVARFDLTGTGVFQGFYAQFSVSPDGSVWVVGPQLARLGKALPKR